MSENEHILHSILNDLSSTIEQIEQNLDTNSKYVIIILNYIYHFFNNNIIILIYINIISLFRAWTRMKQKFG